MTGKEMIEFINIKLKKDSENGHLSKVGEKYVEDRMKATGVEGYSQYWKDISLEDALKTQKKYKR